MLIKCASFTFNKNVFIYLFIYLFIFYLFILFYLFIIIIIIFFFFFGGDPYHGRYTLQPLSERLFQLVTSMHNGLL